MLGSWRLTRTKPDHRSASWYRNLEDTTLVGRFGHGVLPGRIPTPLSKLVKCRGCSLHEFSGRFEPREPPWRISWGIAWW